MFHICYRCIISLLVLIWLRDLLTLLGERLSGCRRWRERDDSLWFCGVLKEKQPPTIKHKHTHIALLQGGGRVPSVCVM